MIGESSQAARYMKDTKMHFAGCISKYNVAWYPGCVCLTIEDITLKQFLEYPNSEYNRH